MHQSDFKPKTNLSGFNPAKQLNLQSSFPNLSSTPMGPAPSTPQFGSTELSKLGSITTPYGGSTVSQFNKSKGEAFHPGLDIANKIGTPIPAYAGGVVTEVVSGKKQGDKAYGNYVIIKDAAGNNWRFSHLYNSYVKVGSNVKAGQIIGQMGNSGNTFSTSGGTGSHLDLRIRDAFGKYQNPMKFFRKTT